MSYNSSTSASTAFGLRVQSLAACALLLTAAACSEAPKASHNRAAPTQQLPQQLSPNSVDFADSLRQLALPGINVHTFESLLVVAIDNQTYGPRMLADTEKGMSAVDAMMIPDMAIVIGSGFVTELNGLQPVGLLQVQGHILNDVQPHGYTRILGINDQGLGVVHRSEFQRTLFASALQAGPGIVESGQLDISKRDLERPKYFRSFIATCGEKTAVGISLEPMNLYTLGQHLIAHLPKSNLQCDEVVNLAGDRETILAAKSPHDDTYIYYGHPNTHKVSLLGFRSR